MKTNLLSTICLLLGSSLGLFAQSTSPNPRASLQVLSAPQALPRNSSQVITFSEFPVGTTITDQYKQIGIIFESGSFISRDASNPTSPVLSGTPRFQGPITGRFVVPGTDQPAAVKSFTFDAGFFDNLTSTRIEWFNLAGEKLGQRINSIFGIEQFTIEGGNIATWTMSIVADEPAGFAIDNVSFVPVGPSILFREKDLTEKEGTWGPLGGDIPGFDHVALHIDNKVYESHPGYDMPGVYLSKDGTESVNIVTENGVQSQFTRATFEHDSKIAGQTKVVEFEEIPIDEELAKKMRTAIESKRDATYQIPDFSFAGFQSLLPSNQKGNNGSFTCIGIVEWASEQAGQNGGQGFIPNIFESFFISGVGGPPFEIPLLSPQLLNYAMKGQQLLTDAKQWVQGLFDPVDFIITDPLGRRLGFTQGVGSFNEIPFAFYPGDGKVEQFLIPQAIPGTYRIKLTGKGAAAFAAVGAKDASESFNGMLTEGQVVEKTIFIRPTPGCMGDVNLDGVVDSRDVTALSQKLNQFTDGLGDPGDLDGNGLLSTVDLELLRRLVGIIETPVISISPSAPAAVCSGAPISLTATPTGFTPTNYVWSSSPAGFSGSGPSLSIFTQNAPAVSSSTTYTITVAATNGPSSITASVSVLVNPVPMAGLTNNGPLSCANGSVTLTASGGATYRFSPGASQNGGPTGNTANVTQTGVYSVTVANGSGCTAVASTSVSGSADLPSAPTLTPSAISTVNLPISVTASGCSGVINWSLVGGSGSANGTVYTVTNPGNYILSATCTVQSCISPATSLVLTINPSNPGGTLTLLAPTYNCTTGAFTFNTSGGDGSPVSFSAIGITGSTTNPNQFVDQALRTAADAPLIILTATQNGVTITYTWNIRAVCPLTPGGGALTLTAPTYNCATGAFTFITSGGDGSPIEYRAVPGITGWTFNPNQFVDEGSRTANDVKPFLLEARQNGVVVTLVWDLKAACGRARLGAVEPVAGLNVSVLGNPVSGQMVDVEVRGATGQSLRLQMVDGQGHSLHELSIKEAGAVERATLRLGQSAGTYFLKVTTDNQKKVVKVVKQ